VSNPLDIMSVLRYEVTGLTEEQLRDAMPLKEVRERILEILYNGESIGKVRLDGGKARLLVGHDIEHDLDCLRMNYPDHLLRYEVFFMVQVMDKKEHQFPYGGRCRVNINKKCGEICILLPLLFLILGIAWMSRMKIMFAVLVLIVSFCYSY